MGLRYESDVSYCDVCSGNANGTVRMNDGGDYGTQPFCACGDCLGKALALLPVVGLPDTLRAYLTALLASAPLQPGDRMEISLLHGGELAVAGGSYTPSGGERRYFKDTILPG